METKQILRRQIFRNATKKIFNKNEKYCCIALSWESFDWNPEALAFQSVFGLHNGETFVRAAICSGLFNDSFSSKFDKELREFRLWALAMAEAVLFYDQEER